jgi:hypothetical protein
MAAALTVTVERPGVGLGSLLLTGADQYIAIVVKNRLNGYIQIWALDAVNNPANFQWANDIGTAGAPAVGTYMPTLVGAIITLPVYQQFQISAGPPVTNGQNYYFKALTGAPTIYISCVG